VIVADFEVLSQHSPGVLETTKRLNQDSLPGYIRIWKLANGVGNLTNLTKFASSKNQRIRISCTPVLCRPYWKRHVRCFSRDNGQQNNGKEIERNVWCAAWPDIQVVTFSTRREPLQKYQLRFGPPECTWGSIYFDSVV
jgi:hypothetical protein